VWLSLSQVPGVRAPWREEFTEKVVRKGRSLSGSVSTWLGFRTKRVEEKVAEDELPTFPMRDYRNANDLEGRKQNREEVMKTIVLEVVGGYNKKCECAADGREGALNVSRRDINFGEKKARVRTAASLPDNWGRNYYRTLYPHPQ